MIVSATVTHNNETISHSMSAVTGHTYPPTVSICRNALYLPSRAAGNEMPFLPATTR